MNKKHIPIIIIVALMLLCVLILITTSASEGLKKENVIRCVIALIVCASALIRLLMKTMKGSGGIITLSFIENTYSKIIRGAFEDRSTLRKNLLKAAREFGKKNYKKALELLSPLESECKMIDDFCAVYVFTGLSHSRLGEYDKAVKAYEKALSYDDGLSTVWSNLGFIYTDHIVDMEKAENACKMAIRCDKENPYGYVNLSSLYITMGNYEKAILPAEEAFRLSSTLVEATNNLAMAHCALGNDEESRKYYNISVRNGEDGNVLHSAMMNTRRSMSSQSVIQDTLPKPIAVSFDEFKARTAMPFYRMPIPVPGNKSKIGGASVGEPPLDSNGKPMRLLAAIYLSEAQGLPDFPKNGLLRFFIADNELYGCDLDDPTSQKDFRVLYSPLEDEELPIVPYEESETFPVKGEYHVRFSRDVAPMSFCDYRFHSTMSEVLELNGAKSLYDSNEEYQDMASSLFNGEGHRLGGYPHFAQNDVREGKYEKYDRLLLQVDTHTSDTVNIHFGDDGVCNFFISSEDLKAGNFSDVLYTWDCY